MAITRSIVHTAAPALLITLCAGVASANVMMFEGLPPPQFGGTTFYSEAGFTITSSGAGGAVMGRDSFGNPGSALGTSSSSMLLHLATSGAPAPFALNSIDVRIFAGSNTQSTTVTGFLTGGGTVSRTITAPVNGWLTVNFDNSWSNVTAVEWTSGLIVYDNIVATIPTPAPAAALGLLGVAATRRRRR
jgi:uncharacterized protein (TIGR03382 family)